MGKFHGDFMFFVADLNVFFFFNAYLQLQMNAVQTYIRYGHRSLGLTQ